MAARAPLDHGAGNHVLEFRERRRVHGCEQRGAEFAGAREQSGVEAVVVDHVVPALGSHNDALRAEFADDRVDA